MRANAKARTVACCRLTFHLDRLVMCILSRAPKPKKFVMDFWNSIVCTIILTYVVYKNSIIMNNNDIVNFSHTQWVNESEIEYYNLLVIGVIFITIHIYTSIVTFWNAITLWDSRALSFFSPSLSLVQMAYKTNKNKPWIYDYTAIIS